MQANNNQLIPMSDGPFPVHSQVLADFLGQTHSNFARYLTGERGDYGFQEGVEFIPIGVNPSDRPLGGRPGTYYMLSINCAKELAMLSGTERGKQARAYFLECERRVKSPALPEQMTSTHILAIGARMAELEQALAIAAPKVAFAEAIEHADQTWSARDVAKCLGIMPQKLLVEKLIGHDWFFRAPTAGAYDRHGNRRIGALRAHSCGLQRGYVVEGSEMINGKEIQCPRITVKGRQYLVDNNAWGLIGGAK